MMHCNNLIYLLDNELFYTAGKETNRKKVILTVEEIKDVLHHYYSDAMGGHSGVNSTLFKISSHYHWNGMKEDIQEYVNF